MANTQLPETIYTAQSTPERAETKRVPQGVGLKVAHSRKSEEFAGAADSKVPETIPRSQPGIRQLTVEKEVVGIVAPEREFGAR